ncbi:MAG TPA: fused response regulator/phosphatase [Gemmatimonadaceae bacterium]|nr:fused response regulator/phosphatase [Gemmatimonadaceae bacterium]
MSAATALGTADRLRVLVADDDRATRLLLRAMLQREGHAVLLAGDGEEAVQRFVEEQPDLVLLDFEMPRTDGLAACRRIKAAAGDRFVPVIFVTSAGEERIAHGFEEGGDGFLTKPFTSRTLAATVAAMRRAQQLHDTVRRQAARLAAHQERQAEEHRLAARLFERLVRQGDVHARNLRWSLVPASDFGGDLLLAAATPSGRQHLLIGDFTGHGLSAALGALPVSEIFYARSAAGYDLLAIARELNARLRRLLPEGMFLAAALVEFDPHEGLLTVWNAGLPDGIVLRPGVGIVHRFGPRHLPIGVLPDAALSLATETVAVHPDDRAFFHTDGLVEAESPDGLRFGQARLEAQLARAAWDGDDRSLVDLMAESLARFSGDVANHDDVALLELTCRPAPAPALRPSADAPRTSAPGRAVVELEAAALRHVDPLPLLAPLLAALPGIDGNRAAAQLVLTELVANALQHGVLGVSSALKATPEGVDRFHHELARARADVAAGWVRVELEHHERDGHHHLVIQVSDSGEGFEETVLVPIEENRGYAGRGLELVRALADRLHFEQGGRVAIAAVTWPSAARPREAA